MFVPLVSLGAVAREAGIGVHIVGGDRIGQPRVGALGEVDLPVSGSHSGEAVLPECGLCPVEHVRLLLRLDIEGPQHGAAGRRVDLLIVCGQEPRAAKTFV